MLTIRIKGYCVSVVVDVKPIYVSKSYFFRNKFYDLDKIYLSFAKIKLFKLALYKLN